MLDGDKERAIAREIELLSQALGEDHFIHGTEAHMMAVMERDKLKKFFDDVLAARDSLDTSYYFATQTLLGDDNENA